MSNEVTLKKIGLLHIRQSERLDLLVKRGLGQIKCSREGFTLVITRRFKNHPPIVDEYTAPTLCEALDKAWEVHGDDRQTNCLTMEKENG